MADKSRPPIINTNVNSGGSKGSGKGGKGGAGGGGKGNAKGSGKGSSGTGSSSSSGIWDLVPKEAKAFLHCLKPTFPPDNEGSPTFGDKQRPGDDSPRSLQSDSKVRGRFSPRQRQALRNWAKYAREKVRHKFDEGTRRSSFHFWMILMCTAVLSSLLSYSIDQTTWFMGVLRSRFTNLSSYPELAMLTVFNVSGVILARLIVRTTVEAEGSGFPEVKAMLFGKVMLSYLTMRVLIVKAVALALGVGAGLPLGKEGPNVHMAACISRTLGPGFYARNKVLVSARLLLAACAVGVGSSFSAPIGGVVFSLELVLPQVFDYVGYTGCFLSAVTGSVCFAAYRTWTAGATGLLPLMSSNVEPDEGALSNYPSCLMALYIAVGAVCGVAGGVWIRTHAQVVGAFKRWRLQKKNVEKGRLAQSLLGDSPREAVSTPFRAVTRRLTSGFQWRDLFQIAVVTICNTVGAASLPLLGGRPQPALLSTLFNKELYVDESWAIEWLGPEWTMFLCFLFKWTITIFALSLPNPAGVVAPTMIIGGLLGRCIGMALPNWFVDMILAMPGGGEITDEMRGAFMARLAIAGAAAFCAAVCRAFAMAITVFEVLALPNALLPLCSSTLAAMFVANKIALPYFDTNLVGRGLGGISALTHTKKAVDPAFTVMRRIDTRIDCIEERTTYGQLRKILQDSEEIDFPIVQHVVRHWADEGVIGLLRGSISREDLVQFIDQMGSKSRNNTEINLSDPDICRPVDGSKPLVRCVPTQINPDMLVQDVYLIMKISNEQVVYVTRENCLLGVINFKELLGHKLNE